MKFDDDLFVVEARHKAWLSPFSEKVKMKVVATGSNAFKVMESSRSILNLDANKEDLSTLSDCISNEVFKLCSNEEIKLRQLEIRMRK